MVEIGLVALEAPVTLLDDEIAELLATDELLAGDDWLDGYVVYPVGPVGVVVGEVHVVLPVLDTAPDEDTPLDEEAALLDDGLQLELTLLDAALDWDEETALLVVLVNDAGDV
jgi:hypothetical protein